MELVFKSLYKKNANKLLKGNKKLKNLINESILDFSKNIYKSKFYRKPLKGLGENIHELQIGGDIRVIIELLIKDNKCYFLNIGTHSSLELSSKKKVKY